MICFKFVPTLAVLRHRGLQIIFFGLRSYSFRFQSYKISPKLARPKSPLRSDFYDLTTFCLYDHSN